MSASHVTLNADSPLHPAERPTSYFVGVTTGQSGIRRIFDTWARILGRPEVTLVGIDLPIHADPAVYRAVTSFIKEDPLSLGGLVTTHKVDLYHASADLFDGVDYWAAALGEASCLAKSELGFVASAKDPITAGLGLAAFLPDDYWSSTSADLICLGAGGSALALAGHVGERYREGGGPARIVVTNRSQARLVAFREAYAGLGYGIPLELVHAPESSMNDAVINAAAPASVVVNATGLGKDAPGSPITPAAVFPLGGIAWDFNYRGNLVFLDQARAQQTERGLQIEDGWIYFLHGWTTVLRDVLSVPIPSEGPLFEELAQAAAGLRAGG
jgi:shikimate 5-dehydrogenase